MALSEHVRGTGVAAHRRFDAAELARYQGKRAAGLESQLQHARAREERLTRLLADVARIATSGTGVEPLTLLDVLEAMQETGEARDGLLAEQLERVVSVLRETA